jgi:hypothetical protein
MSNRPLRSQDEVKDGSHRPTTYKTFRKELLVLILGQPPRPATLTDSSRQFGLGMRFSLGCCARRMNYLQSPRQTGGGNEPYAVLGIRTRYRRRYRV